MHGHVSDEIMNIHIHILYGSNLHRLLLLGHVISNVSNISVWNNEYKFTN